MKAIGARIRNLRLAHDLTLEELGQKLGVSRQTVQRYESGVIKAIPDDKASILAEALSTTEEYLSGESEDPYDYQLDPEHRLDECGGPLWEHFLKQSNYDIGAAYNQFMAFQDAKEDDYHTQEYYLNRDAAQLAQEIYERPELKVLLDASRHATKEDIEQVAVLLKKLSDK